MGGRNVKSSQCKKKKKGLLRACTKMPESKEEEEDGNLPSPYTACGKGIKETKIKKRRKKGFSRLLLWTKMHAAHGNRKEEGKKKIAFLK